jgi:hypothetical protein
MFGAYTNVPTSPHARRYLQWINCTDPGLACTQKLNSTFRIVANPPSATPAELQRQAEQFRNPLTVTVNGQGGPGPGPDPGQCVSATNSAHVQAGRAGAFLFWVWATGSGNYLGLTSATTSLRQTSPGVWTRVDSC